MIRNLFILGLLVALCFAYMVYADVQKPVKDGDPRNAEVEKTAQKIPAFSFEDVDGKNYAITDFKGKTIVLNFWATWCAPCVIEFPQMVKLAAATKERSIFILMSVDENREEITRFVNRYGKNLPQENVIIARDPDRTISQGLFQTYKLPETYIIGPDMTLSEKIIGADVDWTGIDMQQKIKALADTR